MVQKHLCVIGHDNIWYISHCETGQINVEDCHIIIVYLGGGGMLETQSGYLYLVIFHPHLNIKTLAVVKNMNLEESGA